MPINVIQGTLPPTNLVSIGWFCIVDEFSDDRLDLDEAKLRAIVEFNNKLYADTGDMSLLLIGHSDDELPETEQPPIVGYARHFRMATFGNVDPRPAIEAEFLVPPDKVEQVKQLPRRSIELWADGRVDNIALLGASRPHRSLGLMLSKEGKPQRVKFTPRLLRKNPFSKQLQATRETEMDREELAKLVQECLEASPIGQYVKKMIEEDAANANGDAQLADDATATDEPSQAAAVPGAGGAPNTSTPSFGEPDKNKLRSGDEALRLQRDQMAIRLQHLEAQSAKDRKLAQETAIKLRRSEREKQLKQLAYEGYAFDLPDELTDVANLDDAAFERHVTRMKKNYKRDPVGASLISPEYHVQLSHETAPDPEKLQRDQDEAEALYAKQDTKGMGPSEKAKLMSDCLQKVRVGKKA
jgi:hypothetical protein